MFGKDYQVERQPTGMIDDWQALVDGIRKQGGYVGPIVYKDVPGELSVSSRRAMLTPSRRWKRSLRRARSRGEDLVY